MEEKKTLYKKRRKIKVRHMKEFSFSTRIYFGEGALARLRQVEGRRVFLVTDKFMVTSGVADRVASYLTDCQVTVYSDVVPDPPITNVVSGVQALLASGADVMIALGGGSAIDAAKAIRAVAADTPGVGEIREAFAIPTTSGTGSEVTDYSVITDPEKGVKYPLTDKTLQPPVAILDPELVVTVPAAITADTGMDVLTHAVEAYVSTGFNDFSDAMAEKAVSLVCRWLPVAYADGKNLLAREKMHNASCMAGLAFNSAGLGLVHGIAHALGAKLHLPHGRANAIVLPHVLRYNAELQDPKGGDYSLPARKYQRLAKVLDLLPAHTALLGASNFIREVETLSKTVRIPATLREAGVDMDLYRANRDAIIQAALADKCTAANPRVPTVADVSAILDAVSGEKRGI